MARVNGTNASEGIGGTSGNDAIFGYGGNDSIWGGTGHDLLNGGAGADYLHGGGGEDSAVYWNATSSVTVYLNYNHVNSYPYNIGSSGAQNKGEAKNDTYVSIENIHGSTGYGDYLYGDNNNNKIYGHGGNDQLYGAGGNDLLDGGDGHDSLRGGTGNDTLRGGNGNDVIYGSEGTNSYTDIATGGAGSDTFIFSHHSHMVVTDFKDGVDKLVGASSGQSSVNPEWITDYTMVDTIDGVRITHNDGDGSMLLLGIDKSQIDHTDFNMDYYWN